MSASLKQVVKLILEISRLLRLKLKLLPLILKAVPQNMVSFFDIHSYSQLWMSPWGNKNGTPAEYNLMVSRKTNYLTKKKSHLKARTT